MKIFLQTILLSLLVANAYSQNTWEKTFKFSGRKQIQAIFLTPDEGYLIAGPRNLLRINSNGDSLWSKIYDSGTYFSDPIQAVIQNNENQYIFTGTIEENKFGISKVDSIGEIIWTKSYFDGFGIRPGDIVQTNDSGYVVVGYFGPVGFKKLFLFKVNSDGDSLWSKIYIGDYSYKASAIQPTQDNGFIIAGSVFYSNGPSLWIVRTNPFGDTLWTKTYDKPGYSSSRSVDILKVNNDGYVILGNIGLDIWFLRVDEFGDTLWTKTYGGNKSDIGYSIQNTNDMGYIIAGNTQSFAYTGSNAWLIKTDKHGNVIWTQVYDKWDYDLAIDIKQTLDNGYIFAGNYGDFDTGALKYAWVVKTDSTGYCDVFTGIKNKNYNHPSLILKQNYPNPFNSNTKISFSIPLDDNIIVEVFNLSGQKVTTLIDKKLHKGFHEVTWDASDMASGVYFYRIKAGIFQDLKKMILMK